jgi:hypothetical protein
MHISNANHQFCFIAAGSLSHSENGGDVARGKKYMEGESE